MFLFSKSSNYISSSVFILKALMVTHVLHFLARRLDKEEHFFLFFKYTFWWKCKVVELALNFFEKSILKHIFPSF